MMRCYVNWRLPALNAYFITDDLARVHSSLRCYYNCVDRSSITMCEVCCMFECMDFVTSLPFSLCVCVGGWVGGCVRACVPVCDIFQRLLLELLAASTCKAMLIYTS